MVDTYYPWVGVLWQGGGNSTVPYAFCSNNPVNRVDPDGLSDYVWNPDANGGAGGYVWVSFRGVDLNGNRMERGQFFHEIPGSKGYAHVGDGYYIDKATGETVTWDVVNSYVESITPTCNTSNASSETVKLLLEILAQGNNLRPLKGYGLTYVQYGYNGEWYSCLLDIIISDSEMGVLFPSQGLDWNGVTNATILLAGGVAEMVIGGVTEYFSGGLSSTASVPLMVDGLARTVSNAQRLFMYFNGNAQSANAYPTSLGGLAGKGVDMALGVSTNSVGFGQAIGSWGNDLTSFVVMGGNGGALLDLVRTPSPSTMSNYIFSVGSYPYSMYYNKPSK